MNSVQHTTQRKKDNETSGGINTLEGTRNERDDSDRQTDGVWRGKTAPLKTFQPAFIYLTVVSVISIESVPFVWTVGREAVAIGH